MWLRCHGDLTAHRKWPGKVLFSRQVYSLSLVHWVGVWLNCSCTPCGQAMQTCNDVATILYHWLAEGLHHPTNMFPSKWSQNQTTDPPNLLTPAFPPDDHFSRGDCKGRIPQQASDRTHHQTVLSWSNEVSSWSSSGSGDHMQLTEHVESLLCVSQCIQSQ